ncbi:MAG: hypothetical protein GY868_05685 [Deltaproteobacteria bacterium]|nr:hypothetical protein [Deltaproteobacteria bacterium]
MLLVADNLQITNPAIADALGHQNPQPIHEMIKACVTAGAIDINPGPLSRDPEKNINCY